MDKVSYFNELPDLASTLSLCIPDGFEKTFEIDDLKCHLKKDNGDLSIEIEYDEKFDDSYIKEIVSSYKDKMKALDDDLFVEIVEELKTKMDINYFDKLLELEEFDENQAREVEEMIDISTNVISLYLQHKIQDMVELYENFNS